MVTAHKVGKFALLSTAVAKHSNKTSNDGELRELNVIYEGIVQYRSKTFYFDLTKQKQKDIEDKIVLDFPKEAINGSEKVFVSATAELISTNWKDELQGLVKSSSFEADFSAPDRCCEQRTRDYFPKVYWLDFLKTSKKATKEQEYAAVQAIQKAISLLCFQNPKDGSFVSWTYVNLKDSRDYNTCMHNTVEIGATKSSVWQTAYILKLLNHAKVYLKVDQTIIDGAERWLKEKQMASGEWIEIDSEHQIIQTKHIGAYLTSYVYIALNSSDPNVRQINLAAENYLGKVFPSLTHPYDIVITCYALNIANHDMRDICFDKMLNLSKVESNNMRYWLGADNKPHLEITAYGLMTLVLRKSNVMALDVFRYLITKQHPDGKFEQSEQSESVLADSVTTIICTEALTMFVKTLMSYDSKEENMFVDFFVGEEKHTLHIKPQNEIVQALELNPATKNVRIDASGYGRAVARVYWQYNTMEVSSGAFNISAQRNKIRGDEYITMDICTK
jgi:hypothetical protein